MLNTIIYAAGRTVAVYVLTLLLTRFMERKLISQMTFFDFVVGVTMGSLAANSMIDPASSPISSASSLVVISVLAIFLSYAHIKSFRIRKLINSEPVTVVDNGIIVEDNMKKIRLTVNELMMKLREKNAFSLSDVEFAIMETDGQLSVLPKPEKKPLTPYDMKVQATSTGLERDIIIDGQLLKENLISTGLDERWLELQLKTHNIYTASEVFYAGMDNNKKLYISKKNAGSKETHGKYGLE
ncbi:DUF421 domain-containing protein [Clostridium swellfunianum]|uniref:DUF421 domain-containing protein n=1 Tax=Clostridium swellfunianum TaxID=1367462 RepID=UPI00203004F8|nr:DUF421 domain-containing protein [Clostridium swellfunianum]MCM0648349.1 DUF421 domain-containing protein [Clostridium swellfunianum]